MMRDGGFCNNIIQSWYSNRADSVEIYTDYDEWPLGDPQGLKRVVSRGYAGGGGGDGVLGREDGGCGGGVGWGRGMLGWRGRGKKTPIKRQTYFDGCVDGFLSSCSSCVSRPHHKALWLLAVFVSATKLRLHVIQHSSLLLATSAKHCLLYVCTICIDIDV